jgi:hypothetical protein
MVGQLRSNVYIFINTLDWSFFCLGFAKILQATCATVLRHAFTGAGLQVLA